MIHANRIVTVGEQECIIDRPIVLYRGDREVEIEFTLVGNEFMFSEEGNVIKSVNASHGQLVLNTPSGEHMFSELAECHEGKVVFVVTKEMIDEFIEMGFYSFQIRLYDSAEMKSRVTIPPVMNGFDIRNPIAAEDETNVVDQGIVDYARIFKDQSNEELPTFDWTGAYNKTEWVHHDVITENKLNKIEDALYSINANIKESDVVMLNTLDQVKKDADKYVKEHMAEVEADVEEFERNLNTDVQQFKIDTNAAMTAHKNEVSEVVDGFGSQLTQNAKNIDYVSMGYVNVDSFGAKKDDANFDNAEILNYVLNNYTNVIIDGNYYTSDITVNQSVNIRGNARLNNKNCVEHIIRFNSKFEIIDSLWVHGWWKYVNGVVFYSVGGSRINKLTARGCYKCGVVTLAGGNSNSVYAEYIRTEANGVKFTINNYNVENTTVSQAFASKATITINNTLPIDGDTTLFSFIEYNNKLYTITKVEGNILTVYPHFEELPTGEMTLFIGGGLFFYTYNDTNVWTINKFVSTDYSVGYFCNVLYGHTILTSTVEGPRIGFVVGAKGSSFKNYVGHPYIEGNVIYPFVFGPCNGGRCELTIEYPLDESFKIYDINLERGAYSTTDLYIKRYGKTPATDVTFRTLSSSGEFAVDEYTKMIVQVFRGATRTIKLCASKHNYYPLSNDAIMSMGTMTELYLLPLSGDREIQFIGEEGFTVNGGASYTISVPSNNRCKIVFFRANSNWFVIEQQIY